MVISQQMKKSEIRSGGRMHMRFEKKIDTEIEIYYSIFVADMAESSLGTAGSAHPW